MVKALESLPIGDLHNTACPVCLKGKSKQKFTRTKVARCALPFELIHSDLCGPFRPSVGGSVYYLLYIDDCTRYTEVYFLRSKAASEVIPKFRLYKAWVESQGYRIRRFRCDNGRGEYNNDEFLNLLGESAISYEPAPPYSQHKNGVAERMIQTINTRARCMLIDSDLTSRFWAEAVRTAVYLHRRTPTNSLPDTKSPFEILYGTRPQLHHLRRFGCTVYRHIPKEQRVGKFTERARACMMLGYVNHTTKIWRVWDFTGRGRAVETSNVVFVENENAVSIHRSEASTQGESLVFPEANEAGGEVTGIHPIAVPSTPKGMVTPAGNIKDSQGQKSMYLREPGEELGPLWVQPRAERCVTGCSACHMFFSPVYNDAD